MTTLIAHLAAFFAHPLWERIVWTLLHSLWQGALIAVIVALILRRLPALRADARHAVTLAGFAALALALPITFAALTGWNAWTTQHHAAPSTLAQSAPLPPAPPSVAHSPPAPVPSTAAHSGSPNSVAETPQASETFRGWVAWIALLWLLGTTLMLIRTASSLIATRALLRTPALPDHHPLTDTLRTLAARMRLTGPIRLAESDRIATPCVAGLLRPVILLPITALTNLDESQLRAILAHELAHIRRKDLLVALLQRIIESILFFNPAALWLGRQLRVEREACCDALAAEAIDDPHAVARTLAEVAAASRAPVPFPAAALAMTGPDDAPLLQRIRRLLLPNERIPARLPWPSFLAVTLIACASLFTLTITAAQVGETAAKLLKPEERIAQAREIAEEFGDRVIDAQAPKNRVTIKGRVRTEDGSPVPEDLRLVGFVRYMDGDTMTTAPYVSITQEPDGAFTATAPSGEVMLRAEARGFAPIGSDVLRPKPGGAIEGVEIIVGTGYTGTVQVTDQTGAPITEVEIHKSQQVHVWHVASQIAITDANGFVHFDHLAQSPVRLSVQHRGFEAETIEVTLDENTPFTWRLTPTEPLVVTLLDRSKPIPTGFAPLANAEILRAFDTASAQTREPRSSSREQVIATTDDHGRFTIDSLRKETQYVFWVRWGENYQLLPMLTLADSPAEVIVDPPIWIEGEIRGDITRLEHRNEQPIIYYHDEWGFMLQGRRYYGSGLPLQSTVDSETRRFRIGPLIARTDTFINVGPVKRSFNPRAYADGRTLIIDLDRTERTPPGREVVFKLVPPDGWPAPEGRIRAVPVDPVTDVGRSREIQVVDGRASVIVPFATEDSGGKVSLSEPLSLPGYTFQRQHSIEVPPGDGPLVVPVPVQLAGSVFGRVTMPDGSPAGRIHTSIYTVERDSGFINSQSDTTSDGRFVVSAIPLHRSVRLGVGNSSGGGQHHIISEEFRFTEDNLTREINLQFAEGHTVTARILDPDGNPARGVAAHLNYSSPFSFSHQGSARRPDSDGRIAWNHVNLDLPGEHTIEIPPTRDTIGVRRIIDPNNPNLTIQLNRGLHTTGRVIDADTGLPVPNLRFRLHPDFVDPQHEYRMHIESFTDAEGRFSFRNLEPYEYLWLGVDVRPISITYTDSNAETTTVEPRYVMLPLQPGILDQTITVRFHDRARSNRPPVAN